jgi:hypothetical protein
MHPKFLVVLGLCIAGAILKAAEATPLRHLGSKNDNGRPNKHRQDKHPSNYRRRLEDAQTKATESSDYDYGHDDYEHKGYGEDDHDDKGYGDDYSYGNKEYYGGNCDDYGADYYGHGNDYYGFDKGYGYYPDFSYGSGYGYGGDYGFYPDYYPYGETNGYGYPSYPGFAYGYGYPGYGLPGYFDYESTVDADAGTNNIELKTQEGAGKSAGEKAAKTPSKETKSKSDAANKPKNK